MSEEKRKQIKIEYQMFRWGPLLMKTKISEEQRLKFLSEAEASTLDFKPKLAGIIKKEVGFRDSKIFLPFFTQMFDMYADAQFKWSPEVNTKPQDFKQQYTLDSLWANFQGPGDFNPPHDHGGALSWVIYLTIPEALKEEQAAYKGRSAGPGGITFIYGEGPRTYITHHSHFPQEGDMFIFPAGLKHWVFPFKSDCTRVSVSGNVSDSIKLKYLNNQQKEKKMSDDTVLLYGSTELPADDCKVKFKDKHGKQYEIEISRLIQVFNNNIWENKKSVK